MPAPTPSARLLVIAGPTATGKSDAAMALAETMGGEIITADSVQVYRGFDIGSAKPGPEDRTRVPHHLLDILDAHEHMDARDFADRADVAIEAITAQGHLPILCGGTGLWIRALVRGLLPLPKPDRAIRTRLEEEASGPGLAQLYARLAETDPLAAAKIHENDRLRIVRALEVQEQTGQALGELRKSHALGAPRYDALFVAIDRNPEELTQRIEQRLHAMVERGWIDEVRALVQAHGPGARPLGSVGYREILEHVRGETTLDEALHRARKSTRIYARRQRTWLKNEPGITWRTTAEDLVGPEGRARVQAWLEGHGDREVQP